MATLVMSTTEGTGMRPSLRLTTSSREPSIMRSSLLWLMSRRLLMNCDSVLLLTRFPVV